MALFKQIQFFPHSFRPGGKRMEFIALLYRRGALAIRFRAFASLPLFLLLLFSSITLCSGGCLGGADALINAKTLAEGLKQKNIVELKKIRILSLEEAQDLAVKNNPDYLQAYCSIESAKYRYYQALGAYSPNISAATVAAQQLFRPNGGASGDENVFYSYTMIQGNWILFDGLIREFSVLAAERGYQMAEAIDDEACRILIRAVSYAYNDVLLADAQIAIAKADLRFQESMYQDALEKYQAGTVNKSSVLNFQGQANSAREMLAKSEFQRETASWSLAALLGYRDACLPDGILLQAPDSVFSETTLPPLAVSLDEALRNRSDLQALRQALKIAEYGVYEAYGNYLPVLSAFGNYSYSSASSANAGNNPNGFANFYLAGNSFNYGVLANLNIFQGFEFYNQIRAAKSAWEQTKLAGSSQWIKAVNEVRAAYSNYEQYRKLYEIAVSNLGIMREQRSLVRDEYLAGTVEVTRLNQAQFALVKAEQSLSEASVNRSKAEAQLLAAVNGNRTDLRRKRNQLFLQDLFSDSKSP